MLNCASLQYGLIGSTEYGEDFAEWISEHAVAYLNVDVSSAGSRWDAVASPSLAHLIRRTAMDVPHPSEEGKTLWDAKEDEGPFKPFGPVGPDGEFGLVMLNNGDTDVQGVNTTISSHRILEIGNIHADVDVMEAYEATRNIGLGKTEGKDGTAVGPMGSGSDFTVFLQRLGVKFNYSSLIIHPLTDIPRLLVPTKASPALLMMHRIIITQSMTVFSGKRSMLILVSRNM